MIQLLNSLADRHLIYSCQKIAHIWRSHPWLKWCHIREAQGNLAMGDKAALHNINSIKLLYPSSVHGRKYREFRAVKIYTLGSDSRFG